MDIGTSTDRNKVVSDLSNFVVFNAKMTNQIARACHYSLLNILETIEDVDTQLLYRELTESDTTLTCAIANDLYQHSRSFQLFLPKISVGWANFSGL